MSDLVRSRTYSNAVTDENAQETDSGNSSKPARRSKTILGAACVEGPRRELAEVQNWQTQASQDDAKLPAVSTQHLSLSQSQSQEEPQRKKQKIYRSDDEQEQETTERSVVKSTQTSTKILEDLDSREQKDVCMVVEYAEDIFEHLYQREKQTTATYNYLKAKQSPQHLRPSLRAILIDWLIEVHMKFQLLPETLYLAINVMDRFMALRKVSMAKLQLLAVSSLLIAAKFEEINLPKLSQYAYITDGACTCQDIKEAEMYVLTTLKFNIGWPNPLNFLRRISKADDYDNSIRAHAKFFMEYAMSCPEFVDVVPSRISAMATYCARACLDVSIKWSETSKLYSGGIDPSNDLVFQTQCHTLLNEIHKPSTQLKALELKYTSRAAGSVFNSAKVWCDLIVASKFENLF
ncbi:LAFA_0D13168g1_1 [Lachancea sp. 'fantastica']|nr:LAFA_0D13168g1_1 [Lachancea sp. 'fantastica']